MSQEVQKLSVLIAEDHLIARVGISTIINTQPDMHVVAEAANGQLALELYGRFQPDITLMDIRMPVMNGIEATAAIRKRHPSARIIALSTYAGDEDVRKALEAGAQAYLTKEVLHDDLLKAIRAVHEGFSYLPPVVAASMAAQWPSPDLSARELEVLSLIVKGMPNRQIAAALGIAEHTVKNHVKSVLAKLRVEDRTQAAMTALQRGIVHL